MSKVVVLSYGWLVWMGNVMAKKNRIQFLLLAVAAFSSFYLAQGRVFAQEISGRKLAVRLLTADNQGPGSTAGIQDVLPLLQQNLRFRFYSLASSRTVSVRQGVQSHLGRGLNLTIGSVEGDALTVEILRKKRRLLRTRLKLRPGKPIILGGIPGEDGLTLIVVLSLP